MLVGAAAFAVPLAPNKLPKADQFGLAEKSSAEASAVLVVKSFGYLIRSRTNPIALTKPLRPIVQSRPGWAFPPLRAAMLLRLTKGAVSFGGRHLLRSMRQ